MFLKQNDYHMTPSKLAGMLANAGIDVYSLKHFNQGWDFDIYFLNDSKILRVPRRIAVEARLRDEISILELIRTNPWVCVPDYQIIIGGNENSPAVAGYPMLEGQPFDILTDSKSAISDVIKFTTWLHRIQNQYKITLGNKTNLSKYREDAKNAYLSIQSELDPHTCSIVDRYFSWTIPCCGTKVIIHNDLRTDHILVNSGQVSIIDWTDTAWAYPWEEFLWWWLYWGDRIFHILKNHYDGWQTEWTDCIRSVGTWKAILEYYYGMKTHDEHKLLVAKKALRNNYLWND